LGNSINFQVKLMTYFPPVFRTHKESGNHSKQIPLAGGIPVHEVMKKLELEKLLSREERLALIELLKSSEHKQQVLHEIHQLEVGSRQKSCVKRLRILVNRYRSQKSKRDRINEDDCGLSQRRDSHSDGDKGGLLSTREGTMEASLPDIKQAIQQVVGNSPVYSDLANTGVLLKCKHRLMDFISQYGLEKAKDTQFAIIVGSGSCNPVTRMHIRKFFIAKQCIESTSDMFVLGSLLSPAHPTLVRQRFRSFPREILPAPHRLAVAQLSVKDSIWVSVDPWEITRRCVMDYLSLLEHVSSMISTEFEGFQIKVLYLFKANMLPNISCRALKEGNYGAACVCRTTEYDQLKNSVRNEWKGILWAAEDNAILDASMDTVSSRKVRAMVKALAPLQHLVGGVVADYFRANRIGYKVNTALFLFFSISVMYSMSYLFCCFFLKLHMWVDEWR
jgi:nicotinic acid mononucleotide adenylyltransferase